MIATLNNTATVSITDTLGSLLAELDLRLAGESDVVIKDFDQWCNPGARSAAPTLTNPTCAVLAQEMN